MDAKPKYKISMLGPFTIKVDDVDVTPTGRRAKALLALLATGKDHKRSRIWLQDKLWSTRSEQQSSASLRQEVSALKKHFRAINNELIFSDREYVGMSSDAFLFDGRRYGDFLEGLDCRDPEFEDWLRLERSDRDASEINQTNQNLPFDHVDLPVLSFERISEVGMSEEASDTASIVSEEIFLALDALSGLLTTVEGETEQVKATYKLTGTLKVAESIQLSARLVEASTRICIWAGRFSAEQEHTNNIEEYLAKRVVEAIQRELIDGEWASFWEKKTTNVDAWLNFQKGRVLEAVAQETVRAKARRFFEASIDADPNFLSPKISLAFLLLDGIRLSWSKSPDLDLKKAEEECKCVLEIEPLSAQGLALRAFVHALKHDLSTALSDMEKALDIGDKSPELVAYQAVLLGMSGDFASAAQMNRHAIELVKHPPSWIWGNLGECYLMLNDLRAEQALHFAVSLEPRNARAIAAMVACCVRKGDFTGAQRWAKKLKDLEPNFRAEGWRAESYFVKKEPIQRIASELSEAGL